VSEETKFRPTWGAALRQAQVVVLVVLATVVTRIVVEHQLSADDGPQTGRALPWVLIALIVIGTTAFFAFASRLTTLRVTPDGVIAHSSGFRKRLVRWAEIKRVAPSSATGFRTLQLLHESPFPESLTIPMYLDDATELREYVGRHAGQEHPLYIWLGSMSRTGA
jgi:hypothetical protein